MNQMKVAPDLRLIKYSNGEIDSEPVFEPIGIALDPPLDNVHLFHKIPHLRGDFIYLFDGLYCEIVKLEFLCGNKGSSRMVRTRPFLRNNFQGELTERETLIGPINNLLELPVFTRRCPDVEVEIDENISLRPQRPQPISIGKDFFGIYKYTDIPHEEAQFVLFRGTSEHIVYVQENNEGVWGFYQWRPNEKGELEECFIKSLGCDDSMIGPMHRVIKYSGLIPKKRDDAVPTYPSVEEEVYEIPKKVIDEAQSLFRLLSIYANDCSRTVILKSIHAIEAAIRGDTK